MSHFRSDIAPETLDSPSAVEGGPAPISATTRLGNRAIRTLLPRLPFVVLPLALFLALFHPATLDIGNAGWLIRGNDNGENALGMHAWLQDPAPGILRTHLLNAPEGTPLLFTDSNPLIGLVLKPIAPLLPENAQVVGLWLLLCLGLHVFFAHALLRRFAPSPLALWCGVALLSALPTLFNRYPHVNLFAHWVILWALWRFLDANRAGSNRGWAVLIALSALIHNYLLVMVGAIWASAMLERFSRAERRERVILCIGAAMILVMVMTLALLLGAGGQYAAAGNYGAFAMPLDALVNPGNPAFSQFLPSIEQRQRRGFEGFQYLGLGILLLIAVAAVTACRRSPKREERDVLRRLAWLIPAMIVLTLLAVGNHPDIAGRNLFHIPLPDGVINALDIVRASGRLFWPVAYVLVLVAILATFRLPQRSASLILAALLAVQMLDLSGMFATIRSTSAEAGTHRLYVRTVDPGWDSAVGAARDISFEPPDAELDLALFQEVAWRAAILHRPVRLAYTARVSLATKRRLAAEHADFLAGRLAPERLYVLTASIPVPEAARGRLVVLDGVRVVLPEKAVRARQR